MLAVALLAGVGLGSTPACAEGSGPAGLGQRLFAERCALCHALQGTGGGQGPTLAGVVGRAAASTDFAFSRALRRAGLVWDARSLDHFLADPQAAVPGTTMPVRVPEAEDRTALIAYLATVEAADTRPPVAATPSTTPPEASATTVLTGRGAFGDWRGDAPGARRRITPADLPLPFATGSSGNSPGVIDHPAGRTPIAPPGFRVDLFAEGFDNPRVLRVAPNGDVFLANTAGGDIHVLRAPDGAVRAERDAVFASGLNQPFGIAFYPPGPVPRYVYVAETNRVVRFPYRPGELAAAGRAEMVVPQIAATTGGHTTRDIAFSADGSRLFVSVGSASNVAEQMTPRSPAEAAAWDASHALGATWGSEADRADVLSFTPEGGERRILATGLRNCVGLAIQPVSGDLWCSTNERDGLGDDLVPDYVTRVRPGAYYGWPWYYVGDREEPRLKGQRPDLKGRMTDPDVLLQAHSASLGMTFYDGPSFPAEYRGDAFAAEHGSWNRSKRTGYKVIRIRLKDGVATGEYDDFLTGFVIDDRSVWGRPVGIAVAHDGALLVSEDGNGTVWRWRPTGSAPPDAGAPSWPTRDAAPAARTDPGGRHRAGHARSRRARTRRGSRHCGDRRPPGRGPSSVALRVRGPRARGSARG